MIFTGLDPVAYNTQDTSSYNPTINGLKFEELYTDVRTVTVSGRRNLDADIKTFRQPLIHGNLMVRKSWPSREVIITMLVRPTSPINSAEIIDELIGLASTEGKQAITFDDESGWTYYCEFVGYSTSDETVSDQMLLTLKFICLDPFIYKNPQSFTGKSITIPKSNKGQPSSPTISFTATATTASIVNANSGKSIDLTGLTIGDAVILYLHAEEPYPTVNGNVKYSIIDPVSDFAGFTVRPGDVVTSADTITLLYSERRL